MIKKIPAFFVMACMCIFLLGCEKDEQMIAAYNTLSIAAESYNASMQTLGDLYKQGKISDEVRDKAISYGKAYTVSFNTAVDTLKKYYNSPDNFKEFLQKDILTMQNALKILTDFVDMYK